ncbi:MAG: hypothetical protein HY814_07050 [Candidatus Riflebacteria bacterium]|jgi:hypothetical protein|nr:hypothetical protein [Candidatus Riflebacteria bacterium]
MTEKLTWDEIKQRYPDEYVILAEPEFDDNEDPVGGVVLSHGQNEDEALAPVHGVKETWFLTYTGEILGGLISVQVESLD